MVSKIARVFFPECCAGCSAPLLKHENTICLHCAEQLPFTNYADDPENDTEKVFWGRLPLQAASSMIYFLKGGIAQSLMHYLKYKGQTEVGVELGKMAGKDILKSERFSGIDMVVPVPMHRKKIRKRGYNQCDFICCGISEITGIESRSDALIKTDHNESQTRKSKFDRWLNVKTIFRVPDPDLIEDKHILLVDDVVTTGATMEAAALELMKHKGVRVSVYTLALTKK